MHSDAPSRPQASSLNHTYTNQNVPDPEIGVVPKVELHDPVAGNVAATDWTMPPPRLKIHCHSSLSMQGVVERKHNDGRVMRREQRFL